ncbi:MAG TPA: 4Fe-4S binding protein [Casimicrobiaceae bacterium]
MPRAGTPKVLAPATPPVGGRGWLASVGEALRRHRGTIVAAQWVIVAAYAFLVAVPAFLPAPAQDATILSDLRLFARFAFWGIWWPFVILSVMVFGRAWCGLLCPEGALCEFASRHGLGRAIPHWMRWSGWPFVAFAGTTVYGQLVSVYEYPQPVLLILGGSTVAAIAVGFVYGKGKRVWCRYLCPVNGVFALLAKVAPFHFRVDEDAWKRQRARVASVDCAPLLDLRHMKSASACHACGRCSGYRGAIALAPRSPNREIASLAPGEISTPVAALLVFGVLGLALGAFQWTVSPWFVRMKQALAEWLVAHDALALLDDRAPWWVLTHYPEANDVFTWLDGLAIIAYILGIAIVVGGATWLALSAAARLAGRGRFDWKTLAMALVPIGGIGLFLGLSMLTLTQLRAEHVVFANLRLARALVLGLALAWSAWLGARIVLRSGASRLRRGLALLLFGVPLALVGTAWTLVFFVW